MILNGRELTYIDIANGVPIELATEFEKSTIDFSRRWLSGANTFKMHTSGSTASPKSIVLTRESMKASAAKTARYLGISRGDTALVCLPTSFIGGKMMLVRGFELGLNMTAVEPVSNPVHNMPSNFHFDLISLVPLQLGEILAADDGKLEILNRMKCILVGGAALDPKLEALAQQVQAPLYATFGMTETASHIALRRINGKHRSKFFQALPGVEISQDHRGCIRIEAPELLDSPIVANDLIELSGQNQFRWLGRIDNVINSGGLKINPESVEEKIFRILKPETFDRRFFIAGVADPRLGQRLVMIIEGPEPTDSDESQTLDKLRKGLGSTHSPRSLFYVSRFIEATNGKVRRRETLELVR